MNIKKIIREEIGEFDWIEDTNPYEEINLKDESHVNTINIGDRLRITGVGDDMVFNNAEGNVISIQSLVLITSCFNRFLNLLATFVSLSLEIILPLGLPK